MAVALGERGWPHHRVLPMELLGTGHGAVPWDLVFVFFPSGTGIMDGALLGNNRRRLGGNRQCLGVARRCLGGNRWPLGYLMAFGGYPTAVEG